MQKNEEIHYINVVKCWISQLYYHNSFHGCMCIKVADYVHAYGFKFSSVQLIASAVKYKIMYV